MVFLEEGSSDGIMDVVAQTTRILLTDDLDGSEANETVTFTVDGVTYEIDLSDEHARQLRESVADYVDNARKLSGRRTPVTKRAASKPTDAQFSGDRPNTQQVREWAKEHGIEVSERGRLSNDLIVRFQEANG
ncbi:Lsr2 family protein [Kineococcus sp. GCM10028916]|uniref:histone-like nucleoid-structuring protein Lsr2 n=1 Tax=Kineococcus sp. GCM10028916 TaxID=3273394 RepID=UPI0036D39CC4